MLKDGSVGEGEEAGEEQVGWDEVGDWGGDLGFGEVAEGRRGGEDVRGEEAEAWDI